MGETILVAVLAGGLIFGVAKTVQGAKIVGHAVGHKVACMAKHGAIGCVKHND